MLLPKFRAKEIYAARDFEGRSRAEIEHVITLATGDAEFARKTALEIEVARLAAMPMTHGGN